jgi:hypothetical protein
VPRRSSLRSTRTPTNRTRWETQIYQAILERQPAPVIPRLKEILAKPDPALGYFNGELRFWLGWAQEVAGEHAAAQETWRQARSELELFLKEQPENSILIGDLALINMGLGDKAAALALAERVWRCARSSKTRWMVALDRDPRPGSGGTGEPDRAIAALQKLLSIPKRHCVGPAAHSCAAPARSDV